MERQMTTDGDKIAAAILAAKSNTGESSPEAYVGLYSDMLDRIAHAQAFRLPVFGTSNDLEEVTNGPIEYLLKVFDGDYGAIQQAIVEHREAHDENENGSE
jgi:hypothetical protein